MSAFSALLPSAEFAPYVLGGIVFAIITVAWIGLTDDGGTGRRLRIMERRRKDLREQTITSGDGRRGLNASGMAKNVVDSLKLNSGKEGVTVAVELAQAGFRSKDAVTMYLFVRLLMPILGLALSFLLFNVLRVWNTTSQNLLVGTGAMTIIFALLPAIALRNMKQKRGVALLKALPDGLDLFVICAEAGLSLDATFDRVSREVADAHPDLADEFGLTSVELSFMPERGKALQSLADRCPMQGIRSLVSTLIQTERYGTPLAVAMRVLSAEMRNERMMKAEEKAARLPAIMTVPMILFILPPLFVVLIGPAIIKAQDAFK